MHDACENMQQNAKLKQSKKSASLIFKYKAKKRRNNTREKPTQREKYVPNERNANIVQHARKSVPVGFCKPGANLASGDSKHFGETKPPIEIF